MKVRKTIMILLSIALAAEAFAPLKYRNVFEADRVDHAYKQMGFNFCRIPKNSSTMMRIVACDMYRRFRKVPFRQNLNDDDFEKICYPHGWYRFTTTKKWNPSKNKVPFVIVRDPVDRIISLYSNFNFKEVRCHDMTIHEFVELVYHTLKHETMGKVDVAYLPTFNYHVAPQSWHCDLKENVKKYNIVRYTRQRKNLRAQLIKIFKKANVPGYVMNEALRHIVRSRTRNENSEMSLAYQQAVALYTNKRSAALIRAIYHKDYAMFNFERPW